MHKSPTYKDWSKADLVEEVTRLRKRKKYGLVWDTERTREVFEQDARDGLPMLEDVEEDALMLDNSKPVNFLIEGDNYHALSVLTYTHRGKIDAIYIDPPYNTGNKTWKYNNCYIDDDDAYKHSKWISFMAKRLKLARRLLAKNGVICVTIDNNELHNLRHIMEEVFVGKEIITTVIEHNARSRIKNNFALTHEYALWVVNRGQDCITHKEEFGDDILRNLRRTGNDSRRADAPTMFYGIEVDKKTLKIVSATKPLPLGKKIPRHANPDTEMVWPVDSDGNERRWYYGPQKMLEEVGRGECYAKKISGQTQIHYHIPGKHKRRKSIWFGPKYDSSTYGSELLTEIIGQNDFPFPKSIHAVKECIASMTSKKDAIVLDFFAGSGTTGHAVMELNREDGGRRQFILCTNNEGGICATVTLPRLSRVIRGYEFKGSQRDVLHVNKITYNVIKNGEQLREYIEQLKAKHACDYDRFEVKVHDGKVELRGIKEIMSKKDGLKNNLRHFRTAFVSSTPTDENKRRITDRSTEMLCIKENCFEPVRKGKKFRIFRGMNGNHLGIVYYYDGIDPFKRAVSKLRTRVSTYVFSLDDEVDEEDFVGVEGLVTLRPIPSPILNAYRRIFSHD